MSSVVSETDTNTSIHANKKAFMEKLLTIMDYVEEHAKEGVYLYVANEFKVLMNMVKELKRENYYHHLERSYRCVVRNNVEHRHDEDMVTCENCGRVVMKKNLKQHLLTQVCELTHQEKEISARFGVNICYYDAVDMVTRIQKQTRRFLQRQKSKKN